MPVLIYTLRDGVNVASAPLSRGAALAISEHAAAAIRDALVGTPSVLTLEHVELLRALARTAAADSDLNLIVAAIEAHGEVAIQFL